MAPNRGYIETVFGFVEPCETLSDVEAVMKAISLIVADLGFCSFIVTGLPLLRRPLKPLGSPRLLARRLVRALLLAELLRDRSRRAERLCDEFSVPVGDAPYRKDKILARQMMGEAAEFGLKDGFCVPIYGATGWQSAFSFAHDGQIGPSPGKLAASHLLALPDYGRLRILLGDNPPARRKLTPREREVLVWAAAGKSAWETSVLLGISEATVITHLEHTRRKLNVANTTQAVVVALQTGELQPC